MHKLALEVGKKVAEIWNTEVLADREEAISTMVNVRIPSDNKDAVYKTQ